MDKYVLADLSNELLPYNTKVVTEKYTEVVTKYAHRLLPWQYNTIVIWYLHEGTNP